MKIFGINFWLLYSTFIIIATIVFIWTKRLPGHVLEYTKDPAFARLLRAFILAISGPITWLAAFTVLLYRLKERLHDELSTVFTPWALVLAFCLLSLFLLKKYCRVPK